MRHLFGGAKVARVRPLRPRLRVRALRCAADVVPDLQGAMHGHHAHLFVVGTRIRDEDG